MQSYATILFRVAFVIIFVFERLFAFLFFTFPLFYNDALHHERNLITQCLHMHAYYKVFKKHNPKFEYRFKTVKNCTVKNRLPSCLSLRQGLKI